MSLNDRRAGLGQPVASEIIKGSEPEAKIIMKQGKSPGSGSGRGPSPGPFQFRVSAHPRPPRETGLRQYILRHQHRALDWRTPKESAVTGTHDFGQWTCVRLRLKGSKRPLFYESYVVTHGEVRAVVRVGLSSKAPHPETQSPHQHFPFNCASKTN